VYAPAVVLDDDARKSLTAMDRLKAIETETEGVTVEN
jgi:hypothetical protein